MDIYPYLVQLVKRKSDTITPSKPNFVKSWRSGNIEVLNDREISLKIEDLVVETRRNLNRVEN